MKKNIIKHLLNFFKKKKERTNPLLIQPETLQDSELPLNKFGKPEFLADQCENDSCLCGPTECKIDNLIFYESVLLSTYLHNMRKAKKENK
jgi:hypothetical protein